jgi:hypothetical protein
MAACTDSRQCLPTLAVLSGELELHASTIFRMLRDMAVEGVVWQSPSGRFYPATARAGQVRGKPLCFIGREMCHWSRLYQEILSGVSEASSANAGSFVLCSSPSLLRQADSLQPPKFASLDTQRRELDSILKNAPRGCCGFLFDHLWAPEVIESSSCPNGARLQLLRSASLGIDQKHGARLVRGMIDRSAFAGVILVVPFRGDPVIDESLDFVEEQLQGRIVRRMDFPLAARQVATLCAKGFAFLCPEDNMSQDLAEKIAPHHKSGEVFPLIATQGTGILSAPVSRLRYDFRRLGRSAASALLNGTRPPLLKPALVTTDLASS